LLSVTDKTGVVDFARGLVGLGFSILSTGGTFRVLREAGVPATEVADYTDFPEMMDGRVKTLHPKIHGGILARRDHGDDLAAMGAHGIDPIDVVAVNLYRFRETAADPAAIRERIVESIDIGGPSMVRSAAKNHAHVAVVVDPDDYAGLLDALAGHGGRAPAALLRRLASKAFAHTAAYDTAIAQWFDDESAREDRQPRFGRFFGFAAEGGHVLRYGENPQQAAAVYVDPTERGHTLATARPLHGSELSYNNFLDADAAVCAAWEFVEPAAVIVKHNTPCGVAVGSDLRAAFAAAFAADSTSAYGGILAINGVLTRALAEDILASNNFFEVVIASTVEPGAVEIMAQMKRGKDLRVLALGGALTPATAPALRSIHGGLLVQTRDVGRPATSKREVVTAVQPTAEQTVLMEFAWKVCKFAKSNAIVLAHRTKSGALATCGIGAGDTSRVDAAITAVRRAGDRARGGVVASDAFFPFADGLQTAIDAGVGAAIQPGGSRNDHLVVAAADAARIAMVFTGVRHFRH
jgi:phosphoribosylaminoimidazolecarboxamide formyltransferase/IMP cyclohydrolase